MKLKIKKKADLDAEAAEHALKTEEKGLLQLLASTDWYVIRQHETGVAIPEGMSEQRQAARNRINEIREELEN